MTQREKKRLKP